LGPHNQINGKKDKTVVSSLPKTLLCCALIFLSGCSHLTGSGETENGTLPAAEERNPPDEIGANENKADVDTPENIQPHPAIGDDAMAIDAPAPADSVETADIPPQAEPSEAGNEPPATTGLLDETTQQQLDEALVFCESAQAFWQNGELENALEALDKAYSLILTVEPDDPAKMVQQKEDLRFLISKRILEIYASRNIVVNGNHNAIPREINANIQKEIDRFTSGEKRFFIESVKRSGMYRPMILKKLEAAGLPAELSWLPLIESGFKVKALSHARALGLWQFIPSTGYKFGLKRDQYTDERIDFEKATDAAIAYLKELHSMFGDWSTVLAAYNCGEGRVLHVIRTQNINYLDNFWDLYGRLPIETARYVPRFLAALHIVENPEKYGLSDLETYPPLEFETVTIHRQVHLKDVAPVLGTTLNTLKKLNPELRYNVVPPRKYTLRVPAGKTESLLAAIDRLPVSTPPRPSFRYHRVRRGDTLSSIARRYHTSVRKIMRANNLRRASYIVAGKRLKIPQRGMVVAHAAHQTIAREKWNRKHVVKRGDSLWIIAKRYGTTTKRIQEKNHLSSTRLSINQVLTVPSKAKVAAKSPRKGSGTYYVQRGDSPYNIARRHNIPLNRFLKMNNLTPRSTIYPGQSVRIE
jgi:membrane-bound lytic murein transglycosylase D